MSRHVSRASRWDRLGPNEYRSGSAVVRYERGAWWALVSYQRQEAEPPPGQLPQWEAFCDRVGPFKRPRNAMMAAEERQLLLQRREGDRVQFTTPSPGA